MKTFKYIYKNKIILFIKKKKNKLILNNEIKTKH